MFARALHTSLHPLHWHVSPTKGVKVKTPQKIFKKNGGARHVDLWHDVSQNVLMVSTKFTPNDLCQIIRPHQTSRGILPKNTSSKFHPPCAWRSKTVQVIELTVTSARAVEGSGAFRRMGTVDTGAAARASRRRRTFHRPCRTTRLCGYCGLRAPLRSGTVGSSDWPGESIAKV